MAGVLFCFFSHVHFQKRALSEHKAKLVFRLHAHVAPCWFFMCALGHTHACTASFLFIKKPVQSSILESVFHKITLLYLSKYTSPPNSRFKRNWFLHRWSKTANFVGLIFTIQYLWHIGRGRIYFKALKKTMRTKNSWWNYVLWKSFAYKNDNSFSNLILNLKNALPTYKLLALTCWFTSILQRDKY